MFLIGIDKIFHPTMSQYINFLSSHELFTQTTISRLKNTSEQIKKIEIMQKMFSDHNKIQLEITYRNIA